MGGKAPPINQFLLFVYAVTVDYRVYIVPWFTPHMSKVPGILIVCRSNTLFRLSLHINISISAPHSIWKSMCLLNAWEVAVYATRFDTLFSLLRTNALPF